MASILSEIRENNKGRPFRRFYVRRRSSSTGLFEATWQDLSNDVKRWGSIQRSIDSIRWNRLRFGDMMLTLANDEGKYNPNTDDYSFWYGYADQQRTLIKIETGFVAQTFGTNGIWTSTEYPSTPTAFIGLISGDIMMSDRNDVTFPIRPLVNIFRDYPARSLVGYTSTGMTAAQFITMLRDQTDGSTNYIFRPFFDDTTTNWNYTSSSVTYTNLNTQTASDVFDKNVWEVLEKLGEAEQMVPYISQDGKFYFKNRSATTATSFQFFGNGYQDNEYGITIKRIFKYGKKISDYYSRVELKYRLDDTADDYIVTQTALVVDGLNNPWNLGARTYNFENTYVRDNTAGANALAQSVFAAVTDIKTEIEFSTSFVPHLELLDRVEVSYVSGAPNFQSYWDLRDWADDTVTSDDDLYWDNTKGDAINLNAQTFKLVSIDVNLDTFESKFLAVRI